MPAPTTATSTRETLTRALYGSALGPDELVHQRDAFTSSHRDVMPSPRPPLDSEHVAGVGEEVFDVLRAVGELVARIFVVAPLDVYAIHAAPSVGVDQPSKKRLGILAYD